MHLQCKHTDTSPCMLTFKHMSQSARPVVVLIDADSLYLSSQYTHAVPFSPSCSHLHLQNDHLMTPAIFHPSMQYPLFTSTANMFAKQHLCHQLSKIFPVQFLHLSICDVLQKQLLSNPSPQPESAWHIHSVAAYRGSRSWLKRRLLVVCGPFAIAANAG